MGTAVGQWLEEALVDLCRKTETGLNFDRDVISGLVSYCDLAQPVDAKEYLDVILLSLFSSISSSPRTLDFRFSFHVCEIWIRRFFFFFHIILVSDFGQWIEGSVVGIN